MSLTFLSAYYCIVRSRLAPSRNATVDASRTDREGPPAHRRLLVWTRRSEGSRPGIRCGLDRRRWPLRGRPGRHEKARFKLANALLSVAHEDSHDVEVLKNAALRVMALGYRRRSDPHIAID